jgi:hypothetical protein
VLADALVPLFRLVTGKLPVTWVARLTFASVPPSVRLPLDVTVPVSVMPLTVPVPPTLVTVPEPLLLNVVQSVEVKYPLTELVAAAIEIVGVVPPELTTGAVPETLVTLLLKVVQSADVNAPRFVADADGRLKVCVSVALEILKFVPELPVAKY